MTKISYISVLQMFFNYIKHNVQCKSYLQTCELHKSSASNKNYLLHTIIFLRFRQRKTSEFLQAAHCFILLHMRKSMETRIAIFIPAHRAYRPSKETQISAQKEFTYVLEQKNLYKLSVGSQKKLRQNKLEAQTTIIKWSELLQKFTTSTVQQYLFTRLLSKSQ